MAHFFLPHAGMNAVAAENSPISEIATSGGWCRFGVYGGGWSGERLIVKVYRGNQVVVNDPKPERSDPAQNLYFYTIANLRPGDEIYGMLADGGRFTGALKIVASAGKKPSDEMAAWAKDYTPGTSPGRHFCDFAIPYLALKDPEVRNDKGKITHYSQGMPKLDDALVGGMMTSVHGLAMHTTALSNSGTSFQTAANRCVGTWNSNHTDKGIIASAHFAIGVNGDLIQIVPTNRVAFAQGKGDPYWISVEVQNDGLAPMNEAQLTTSKRLFRWVCSTYGVEPKLALGCIYPHANKFDDITIEVCEAGGSEVTNSTDWSVMSRGLSCHWWLDPRNHHACPGPGMLRQMASIVKAGPVS